jgi:DNA invertase Pin-like site-specific DNA recombinase
VGGWAWAAHPAGRESLGVDFISYNEGADTTTPPGKPLFGIMASLAEFERALIVERVKAGMTRAKAQGKPTGRPRLPAARRREVLELVPAGQLSPRTIGRKAGVSHELVRRIAGRPVARGRALTHPPANSPNGALSGSTMRGFPLSRSSV